MSVTEHEEVAELSVLVHPEGSKKEIFSPMTNVVKPKISVTSKVIPITMRPRLPEEVMKHTESVDVEEVVHERSKPCRQTVPSPPDHNKTALSHPMKALLSKGEVVAPKILKFPSEDILIVPKAAVKSYHKDIVPLERPTQSKEVFLDYVPATAPPVPVRIPSPKKEVCVETEVLQSEESVVLAKKTSKALPNALSGPKENFALEEACLPKESPTNENVASTKLSSSIREETQRDSSVQKPASLAQKIITPKLDSSKETTTTTTKHQSTRDDKKSEKETQEIEGQTLQKCVLCLTCVGS